ncbi:MAG: transposase [Desulfovibrio sp.]|nr:transposase [Desulfovibrio sp.]
MFRTWYPTYSPDLNPVEKLWSKLKTKIRAYWIIPNLQKSI